MEDKEKAKTEEQTTETIDTTISDTILDFQAKYEEEHKLRLETEKKVADLSRLVRTMGIDSPRQQQEESLEDKINKLFN